MNRKERAKRMRALLGKGRVRMAEGEVGDLGHALNLHCVHCLRPTK